MNSVCVDTLGWRWDKVRLARSNRGTNRRKEYLVIPSQGVSIDPLVVRECVSKVSSYPQRLELDAARFGHLSHGRIAHLAMSVALPQGLEGRDKIMVLPELLFRDHQSLRSDEAARPGSFPLRRASPIDGVSVDRVDAAQW
jgi:hypothetical protein